MAANAGVTLDTITIEIESSAGGATANIEKLTKTLGELKSSIKGGFNNLKKLADALNTLNKASEGIPNAIKKLNNLREISQVLSSLDKIQKPKGLKSVIDNLEKIPATFSKIDTTVLDNVARVSNGLANALNPLANNLSKVSMGLSSLSTLAKNYGMSITRVADGSKKADDQLSSLSKTARFAAKSLDFIIGSSKTVEKVGVRAFKKIHSKVKQVALSLLGTRTLFTMIRKAISEYMAMDVQLTKATQNLWRALGAQLAPAVEYVLFLFKHIVRVIYSVVYALTGIDLIARANAKAMDAMSKSAKNALGNLQKFDDLNVVEFDKGTGEDMKIELEKIDLTPIQKVIDWMKRLKEAIQQAWKDGGWDQVAVVLADGVNEAFAALDPVSWGNKIGNGIVTGLSFIKTYLATVKWDEVGQKIGDTIRNLPWRDIWNEVVEIAKEALGGLDDFFDGLFDSESAGELTIAISGILMALNKINDFKVVDIFSSWVTGVGKAKTAIGNISDKITNIAKLSKSANALGILSPETVKELTGLGPKLQGVVFGIGDVGDKIKNIQQLSKNTGALDILSPETVTIMTGIGPKLQGSIPILGKFFGLFSGTGIGAIGSVIGVIAAVVVVILALVKAFKNLYQNNEEFRKTWDELVTGIKDVALKIFEKLKEAFEKIIGVLSNIWQNVLIPLFDLLVSVLEPFLKATVEILNVLWKTIIAPLADFLMSVFSIAIDAIVWGFDLLVGVINAVIKVFQWLWDNILDPIVGFLLNILVGAIKFVGEIIGNVVNGIKNVVESVWGFVKKVINWILDGIESFINAIIRGLNWLIKQINKISFDVPDWVPGIGGKTMGFNLKTVAEVTIPKLETGTNEIPYEGIYHLHPGEAVVPKKYNPALGNGTDEELGQKLDTLINIMGNMNWTNVVNIGNKTIYKEQQRYNKQQNDKYGTTVNL